MLVGGGSGGHVTPLVAVAAELKRQQPGVQLQFWTDRRFGDTARGIVGGAEPASKVTTIFSGKIRRYHKVPLLKQLADVPTVVKNIADLLLVGVGMLQSTLLLVFWRPDVVFTKGGYVCLPVGCAARLLKIPLVIHDSDAHPGLTNRILSGWAVSIATGAPLHNYSYPPAKSQYVGIPIASGFKPYTEPQKRAAKAHFGLPDTKRPLVVVTGGGLGAQRINDGLVSIGRELLQSAMVVHVCGTGQLAALESRVPQTADYQLYGFVHDMMTLLGAADVVVTRAGATTLLELAALATPTIIIPNGLLSGGHQLKNAAVYQKARGAIVLDEQTLGTSPEKLLQFIEGILSKPAEARAMGQRFASFARPQAAQQVAQLILSASKKSKDSEL